LFAIVLAQVKRRNLVYLFAIVLALDIKGSGRRNFKGGFSGEDLRSSRLRKRPDQGCQMDCFHTKNPNLGKFWKALEWKMLVCIFYGQMVYFMAIW
jgi:hypothetical protein